MDDNSNNGKYLMIESQKTIPLEVWEPDSDEPYLHRYVKGRMGLDVFKELRQRLTDTGFLPDEYFSLRSPWEYRRIPKYAWYYLDVDYGASEGIYLDMILYWDEGCKHCHEIFATGKTLSRRDEDLDRMFLIASAIRKAFHYKQNGIIPWRKPLKGSPFT